MTKQETEDPDQAMPEKALKELFAHSHDRGLAGLPVMSLSMGRGLVPRNQDERRVETNLSDEQHRLVRAGELAYNMMRMWQGVCGLAEEDCLISPAYVVVRPLNGMDPKFSEYLLTYEETVAKFKLLSFGVVDDRLRLYFKDFERVRVRIPSPPAQRKIARILTTLDNLIHKTEALITKYQAIKQGMMHDLFTRGIGAHGHLRAARSEAPDLYRQSELSWIPKEWLVESLEDISASLITYGIVQPGPHIPDGVPFIQTKDLTSDSVVPARMDRTTHLIARNYRRSAVAAGDLVCGIRATVGVVLQVPPDLDGANISRGVARISPKSDCSRRFLLWAMRSRRIQDCIKKEIKGTTYAELTLPALRRIKMLVPPRSEQNRIAEGIDSCDRRILFESRNQEKLQALKTGLMQDLLTGKVRVKVDETEEAASND